MLMIKRRKNESLTITTPLGTLVIAVSKFNNGGVLLAIDGPREVFEVTRTELIKEESNDEGGQHTDANPLP